MTLYELVVVMPFASYKRGNVIKDPVVVSKLLDAKDEMHSNISSVRRTNRVIEEKLEIIEEIVLPEIQETIPEKDKPSVSKLEKKR